MLKKMIYGAAGMLIFQSCKAMREDMYDIGFNASHKQLKRAIKDKTTRGYTEKRPVNGIRPSPYDMIIDKLEAIMPKNWDEHYFVLFNCKFSSKFYKYRNDVCIIADHIIAINKHVFSYNWWFKRIQLPSNLIGIGSMAFAYSDLEEIDIPDSVIGIAPLAFANCEKLERVTLSKNTIIGNYAFANCPNVKLIYRDVHRSQHGVI